MIGYLWEIDLSSTDNNAMGTLAESLVFKFQTKYSSAKKPECSHDLNLEFTINNYKVNVKCYLIFFAKSVLNFFFVFNRL